MTARQNIFKGLACSLYQGLCILYNHSDYRTVSPYWVLPVYVELIRAVWADEI
jgi:hypothetical protein